MLENMIFSEFPRLMKIIEKELPPLAEGGGRPVILGEFELLRLYLRCVAYRCDNYLNLICSVWINRAILYIRQLHRKGPINFY